MTLVSDKYIPSALEHRLVHRDTLLLASKDIDEVIDVCTRTLRPHRLSVHGKQAKLDTRLHHLQLGHLSFNRLFYGGHVSVTPAMPEEDNFLISIPLRGNARFQYGDQTVEVGAGRGAVISPYENFRFDIDDEFDQIVIRLDRRCVESTCANIIGRDQALPVHFELALQWNPKIWDNLIEVACNLPVQNGSLAHARLAGQLEDMIITSLLLSQPNSCTNALLNGGSYVLSMQIRRAMEYMLEHLHMPLRMSDVAKDCGMSLRSMQAGFQRDLGVSPAQWLRTQRLEKAHAIFRAADPGRVTITEVAVQYGFLHLGDFAAKYKAHFGENPSQTLAERSH